MELISLRMFSDSIFDQVFLELLLDPSVVRLVVEFAAVNMLQDFSELLRASSDQVIDCLLPHIFGLLRATEFLLLANLFVGEKESMFVISVSREM